MCHAIEEDDWIEVIMPCLEDTLKGEPCSDGDRENLKDVCDGGDIERLGEHGHESNIGSACTDAQSDDGSHCTVSSTERELILCPNRCGVQMPAEDMEDHLRQKCRRAIVACEFAGCGVELPRAEMQYHYRNEMPTHLLMLSKNVATILNKMEALEAKQTTASSGCRSTRKENRCSETGSGGSKRGVQADTASAAAQPPSSGGFLSLFPSAIREMFTKKTSMVCSTCHEEFRCNSAESVGVVNCERYWLLLCVGRLHVVLACPHPNLSSQGIGVCMGTR